MNNLLFTVISFVSYCHKIFEALQSTEYSYKPAKLACAVKLSQKSMLSDPRHPKDWPACKETGQVHSV